ncbi:MAG: hypothetical protein WCR97_04785 [Bacilli bacterium]
MKIIEKTKATLKDKEKKVTVLFIVSFIISVVFAIYNLILGIYNLSWWFVIMGIYYLILCIMKFIAGYKRIRYCQNEKIQLSTMRIVSIIIIPFIIVLIATIAVSLKYELMKYHTKIIMITIAAYTFYKVITSIINYFKAKKSKDSSLITIRNINTIDALVSILNLQMSMLVSFEDGDIGKAKIMNIITGFIVCALITYIAIWMLVYSIKHKEKRIK